jgi:uncharacterized protein YndB with AHSA1/START domain
MTLLRYALVGVVALLVLAIAVLLIMGARSDHQIAASVEIARPADVVFTWITDPPRLQSWVGWLVEVRNMTPQQAQVGARQLWVMEDRNDNNQRMDIQTEYVTYLPNQNLNARLNSPGAFTGSVDYRLEPIGSDRTRLSYTMAYEYDNWFVRLLEPLIAMSAQQKLEEDLARLKEQAESEPYDSAQGR